LASLRDAASSATDPGSRAASEIYESAKGQMTVTSQQRALSLCHGTSERPSGRFPSEYYYYYYSTQAAVAQRFGRLLILTALDLQCCTSRELLAQL